MILDTIVARKREEVARLRREGLPVFDQEIDPPRGLRRALATYPGVAIIAEAKKASPSKGVIQPDFDPVRIGRHYQRGGAQAMSVLTDVSFFQGALSFIPQVRQAVDLPVLRKDFLIDPLQVEEARLAGADAILLIAAILEREQLRDLRLQAEEGGMDVLVEVHDGRELDMALVAGSRLIGINNRNLRDFSVSLDTTFLLCDQVPDDILVVSESGIATEADMRRLADHAIGAALIGERLMRSRAPETLLAQLLAAGRRQDG